MRTKITLDCDGFKYSVITESKTKDEQDLILDMLSRKEWKVSDVSKVIWDNPLKKLAYGDDYA